MDRTDVRACVLGDSFVLGYGDPTGRGWPGRVLESACAEGADLTLYNLGVRRETGPEVAARWPEVGPRLRRGDRGAVIVAFGSNDIDLGVSPDDTVAAMQTILGHAGASGYAAFAVSPPVFSDEPEFDAKAASLTADMARACDAPFLNLRMAVPDWSVWWSEAAAGDGAHPNGAYDLIAQAVAAWRPWREWLGLPPST
jgi:acyl-CoA thioesterase-1